MSHGYGGSYTSNISYTEAFAEAGIASYIFDFCGGSSNSKSDGSTLDMSVLTEAGHGFYNSHETQALEKMIDYIVQHRS